MHDLNWIVNPRYNTHNLFFRLAGGAVHDGYLNAGPPDRKNLGSRLLFRESVEAGDQLTQRVSLSVMLDHASNAGLASHNQGLTNFGARIGVAF